MQSYLLNEINSAQAMAPRFAHRGLSKWQQLKAHIKLTNCSKNGKLQIFGRKFWVLIPENLKIWALITNSSEILGFVLITSKNLAVS